MQVHQTMATLPDWAHAPNYAQVETRLEQVDKTHTPLHYHDHGHEHMQVSHSLAQANQKAPKQCGLHLMHMLQMTKAEEHKDNNMMG